MKAITKGIKSQVLTDTRCPNCLFYNREILECIPDITGMVFGCWYLSYTDIERTKRMFSKEGVIILI